MTLLEFCQAIPGWGQFIRLQSNETDEVEIYINLLSINEYKQRDCATVEEHKLKEISLDYFDAVMSNLLPSEYCIKYNNEEWDHTVYRINTINAQILTDFEIVIDQKVRELFCKARRPYYRARGKVLGKETIADGVENTIHLGYLIDVNNNITKQAITSNKFPNTYELLSDIIKIIQVYKGLNLIIAVTDWDEMPEYAWEIWPEGSWKESNYAVGYPGFLEHIEVGIWIHNKTIEFMDPIRTREKYLEYNALYGADTSQITHFKR